MVVGMQKIIQRTTQDGGSITQTVITVYDGGPEPGELEQVKAGFEDILEQGRRQRRWLVGIGAAVLFLEGVILTLWP